jgi:hypothetical protein
VYGAQILVENSIITAKLQVAYDPIPENISGRKLTQVLNSVISVLVHQEAANWGGM